MICASGEYDDGETKRPMMLLGLSAENVRRMAEEREPIWVEGKPFGFDGFVMIFGGYGTEEELTEELGQVATLPEEFEYGYPDNLPED